MILLSNILSQLNEGVYKIESDPIYAESLNALIIIYYSYIEVLLLQQIKLFDKKNKDTTEIYKILSKVRTFLNQKSKLNNVLYKFKNNKLIGSVVYKIGKFKLTVSFVVRYPKFEKHEDENESDYRAYYHPQKDECRIYLALFEFANLNEYTINHVLYNCINYLKHELIHRVQYQNKHIDGTGKLVGFAKKKILHKNTNIYTNNVPYELSDEEFKPLLLLYIDVIKTDIKTIKSNPLVKNSSREIFLYLTGATNSINIHSEIKTYIDERILYDNTYTGLRYIKKHDFNRWKQMVKELYKEIFK